jgi:hypothetical protein
MKKVFNGILLVIALAALFVMPAYANDVYTYGGHSYFLTDELLWSDAETVAQAAGGHLVTVNDADEQQWLTETFTDGSLWIGLYQLPGSEEPDQGFVWASGAPVTFTNWAGGEPNNFDTETFVAMNEHFPGGWNDLPENYALRGIAEVPEPCSLAAIGVGLGFLLNKKRRQAK